MDPNNYSSKPERPYSPTGYLKNKRTGQILRSIPKLSKQDRKALKRAKVKYLKQQNGNNPS